MDGLKESGKETEREGASGKSQPPPPPITMDKAPPWTPAFAHNGHDDNVIVIAWMLKECGREMEQAVPTPTPTYHHGA